MEGWWSVRSVTIGRFSDRTSKKKKREKKALVVLLLGYATWTAPSHTLS